MQLAFDKYEPGKERKDLSPVILLHGRLDSRKTWKKLAPDIATKSGRTVYAYDARNHGDSPWSDEMDFNVLADDLRRFLKDHAIEKAVLVGHSMGGKTAIVFALQEPEKVEKLFVEDMVAESYSEKAKDTVLMIIHLLRKSLNAIPDGAGETEAQESVYKYLKSFLPPDSTKGFIYEVDTLPLKKVGEGYAWKANLDVLEYMLKNRSAHQLSGKYDREALFLYGNKSFFDVANDESVNKYFPRAVKICVEGAGHLIHQDYPEEFLQEVLKFI